MSKQATAIALAATLAMTAGNAIGQKRQLTMQERQEAATEEDLLTNGEYWRDYEEWMSNWVPVRKRWDWLETEEIARGQEKRPVRRRMVILDPPLPKTREPDSVEVEVFLVLFDGPASERVWGATATTTLNWHVTWTKGQRGGVPVRFVWRVVGKGPNLLRQYNENRLLFQQMLYAWGDGTWSRDFGSATVALHEYMQRVNPAFIDTKNQAEHILKKVGTGELEKFKPLPVEKWRELADSEVTQRRIEEADSRYAQMMLQGIERNRKLRMAPQDPIILIDGKYLFTGQISRDPKALLRMANWIIRRRVEEIEAAEDR